MAQPLSTPNAAMAASRPRDAMRSAVLWGGTGVFAVLVVVALALWFHYGTALFFETIAVGIANCF